MDFWEARNPAINSDSKLRKVQEGPASPTSPAHLAVDCEFYRKKLEPQSWWVWIYLILFQFIWNDAKWDVKNQQSKKVEGRLCDFDQSLVGFQHLPHLQRSDKLIEENDSMRESGTSNTAKKRATHWSARKYVCFPRFGTKKKTPKRERKVEMCVSK